MRICFKKTDFLVSRDNRTPSYVVCQVLYRTNRHKFQTTSCLTARFGSKNHSHLSLLHHLHHTHPFPNMKTDELVPTKYPFIHFRTILFVKPVIYLLITGTSVFTKIVSEISLPWNNQFRLRGDKQS